MEAFDHIIGYNAVKQELMQISDTLANSGYYKKFDVLPPRGIMLCGEPGVGKTLMANAVIAASGRKAFICRKDQPNGTFVTAIRQTFEDAAAAAPSIVFLDDMDKFADADRANSNSEEYVTVQACIDNVKGKAVFVIATANSLSELPESLLRPGRFDRIIRIKKPSGEDAEEIVKYYLGQKKHTGAIDASVVAKLMDGHSCAELETVINEAGVYAGFERSDEITTDHFMKACLHTVYDVPNEVLNDKIPDVDLSDKNDLLTRIVYHEAGHAVVSEALIPGSVTLVTAYNNRVLESGGFTLHDRQVLSKMSERSALRTCISLGGMAALDQKFGIRDEGSYGDIGGAFEEVLDDISGRGSAGFSLCSKRGSRDSDELKTRREQAAASEIEKYYRKAKEIISANRELLEAIARDLSRKAVLTMADISRIEQTCPVVPASIQ